MAEESQPENGIKESLARIAESMEQQAMTSASMEYLSRRVVQLREQIIGLQALNKELMGTVERLKEQIPKDEEVAEDGGFEDDSLEGYPSDV